MAAQISARVNDSAEIDSDRDHDGRNSRVSFPSAMPIQTKIKEPLSGAPNDEMKEHSFNAAATGKQQNFSQ